MRITRAAEEVGIPLGSAKRIVQIYRKTGRDIKLPKRVAGQAKQKSKKQTP